MICLRNARHCLVATFLSLGVLPVCAEIAPSQARQFVGQSMTVCGAVRSTRYAFTWKGAPTFITLDTVQDDFAIVIWGKYLAKFHRPDFDYERKNLCVSGKIRNEQGHLRVEVKDPAQISIQQTRAATPPPTSGSLFDESQTHPFHFARGAAVFDRLGRNQLGPTLP